MSVYSVKGKGWRYDFTHVGQRHTGSWFRTKAEARQAEAREREDLARPRSETMETPTDMTFLELLNLRLDHVKAYNGERHYQDHVYAARRWARLWGKLPCAEVNQSMIERFILERRKVSPFTANKEIRYLRALFNFAKKRKYVRENPLDGLGFLPTEKRVKYVPDATDIDSVIEAADRNTQDYLWAIRETMARVSEINRLRWDDVSLDGRHVVLYTRKKKGGHLTPRRVPMTERLHEILSRRFRERDSGKPWVFWHRYWSARKGGFEEGPYQDRKLIMRRLCEKAGVRYFRYHALRHSGASIMENQNVPIGAIQRILGHENRTTTEIYLHSIGEVERQAISAYEKATRKSLTQSLTR